MDSSILLVGLGGLLGSVLRYMVALFFAGQISSAIPYATLTVNIIGCFLIGILFALSDRGNILSPEWRVFLTTGFCGGFKTIFTFFLLRNKLMPGGGISFFPPNFACNVTASLSGSHSAMSLIQSITLFNC